MSKSVMYAANTNTQTVAAGGVINFGSIIRKYGCNCNLVSGNAIASGNGYYRVDASITVEGTAAGTGTIALYKNGVAIPGAVAQYETTATSISTVSIPCVIRDNCCCESETITAVVSGTTIDIPVASILIQKY